MVKLIKYTIFGLLLVLALLIIYFVFVIPLTFDKNKLPLHYGKVHAELFLSDKNVQPLVVYFGGSEGGNSFTKARNSKERQQYIDSGYAVLAIGYFGMDGIPKELDRISLNGVYDKIAQTLKKPNINSHCVAVIGGSKGAELALSLSSKYPLITTAVSLAGSNVGFASPSIFADGSTASYMFNDKALPFVPFTSEMLPSLLVGDLRRASEIALQDKDAVEKAKIKVENINGPVLLISGEKDHVWPSKEMSDDLIDRLEAKGFKHAKKHIVVPNGDHFQPQNEHHIDVITFLNEYFLPTCTI